jgi:sugar/nucleoside kinase (ribokinase family)
MDFWIEGKREHLLRTLKEVDILLVNDSEAKMLAGESNLVLAAKAIQKMGPRIVVIKQGEYGALLFDESGVFHAPAMPLARLSDPTGCGDTFAGGFIGYLTKAGELSNENLRKAMIVGSVMASFNVEDFSLDRMRTLTIPEIVERYAQLKDLVTFTDL